ncbi:uncharacterized protein LOC110447786 [Mizuhopecten yessoensis]|uniref:Mab-21-like HhH/H2TH-like domain-containing protein n=1 Tax=Mizuhopecten yessoensis TaxID=6573 RepID=A0A210QUH6_MIZYE|nr:uncharacterized protein LOC110447786 [Mizuhopecten yessoensis]OWF52403.1 hypothetical protein KP79_PYT22140 [Mizuhopecten yessoensis]
MTEDEDDDIHGGATGETHILDHMPAPRENDDKPWAGCDRKSPPWLSDKTNGVGSSTCNPELCHVNLIEQECTTNLTDDFAFITAEMLLPEPIANSLDQPLDSKPSLTGENVQDSVAPFKNKVFSAETGFQASEKSTERYYKFLEEADETSAMEEQESTASMDKSQSSPDNSSLASGQSCVTSDSGACRSSLKETDSQPFDGTGSPCHPPYSKLYPFRPVSAPNGFPSTNSPVKGCKPKSPPKSIAISEPVAQMEFKSNENRGMHIPQPSCRETVGQNHSMLLGENTPAADENPPKHAPVIRLCRPKDGHVSLFYPKYTPRTFSYQDFTFGTPAALLTFTLKHFISPKEVKLFNIGYFRKILSPLFACFVEFCGQGANGLACFISDLETSKTCKACSILQNALKPLNVLIRNPRCWVYSEEGPDVTPQDAILTVVSAGTGLVRLIPTCPATWEQWAHFSMDIEGEGNCFIKHFTQTVESGDEIRQCLTCLQWPTEIEKEFRERKRESNWLDQNTLREITKTECRVVPFLQQHRSRHDIDWLLIFPEAERRLADLLTNEQRHCFYIFHLVMQHQLLTIPQAEESITAISQLLMHLDHVLLHACDTVQNHMWKMSPGSCFLYLVRSLGQFLHDRHLPHYVVRNRNLLTKLSVKDFGILEAASQETLRSPLQLFQKLFENHKLTNAWVLNELDLCNRLIGGHGANNDSKRVLLPLALRLSKEFMRRQCPEKAFECIEVILNAVATSETDRNNPYTTDVSGFFAEIPNSEKDVSFLCRLTVYLKLSLSIDISSFLPDVFTSLQEAIGPSYQLSQEIKDLPFPKFTDYNVSEKVYLLEGLAFQLTHYSHLSDTVVTLLKGTYDIAARAIDNLKEQDMREDEACLSGYNLVFAINTVTQNSSPCAVAPEEEILRASYEEVRLLETETCGTTNRDRITADTIPSFTTDRANRALEAHTYKVMRSLRESQFRCLWNLFRCYEVQHCLETIETHLDELDCLCEQLGDPKLYIAFGKIPRRLGHVSRARQADEMAQIRDNVEFGV